MTFLRNKSSSFIIILLLAVLASCSARIDGVVKEGGATTLNIKTSLEPRTSALIRSLMSFMREDVNAPILDGVAISRSMAAAPGINSVSLKNTGSAALEGSISIANVGSFLALSGAKTRFITYTEGRTAGSSSIVIVLNRESAPEIISMLSPEIEEYLSALMAPVVLGETSTRQEYLNLLTSIYGRPLSDEIAAARIRAFIEFPRPVTEIRGGNASGKQAEFDIPITDILVLERPLYYSISW